MIPPETRAQWAKLVEAWEGTDTGCCHCGHALHPDALCAYRVERAASCGCNNSEEHPLIVLARNATPRLLAALAEAERALQEAHDPMPCGHCPCEQVHLASDPEGQPSGPCWSCEIEQKTEARLAESQGCAAAERARAVRIAREREAKYNDLLGDPRYESLSATEVSGRMAEARLIADAIAAGDPAPCAPRGGR